MASKKLLEKEKQKSSNYFVFFASVTFFFVGYYSKLIISSQPLTLPASTAPEDIVNTKIPLDVEEHKETAIFVSTEKALSPDLEHKYETIMGAYENILRSCLGDYCFNSRPDSSTRDRIGVLGPPGTGAGLITTILNKLAKTEHPKVDSVEIVHSTNVPPYGYGKNHGWNRMIRISRRLLPHAYSVLREFSGEEVSIIDETLYSLQVKQIVRWQCRLSHVAAHTRMLTVFTEDIILRPNIEFEKMLSFVGLRLTQKVLDAVLAEFLGSLEQGKLVF
jgi:hypothetical protein